MTSIFETRIPFTLSYERPKGELQRGANRFRAPFLYEKYTKRRENHDPRDLEKWSIFPFDARDEMNSFSDTRKP